MPKKKPKALVAIMIILLIIVILACAFLLILRKYTDKIQKINLDTEEHYAPGDVNVKDGVDERADGSIDLDDDDIEFKKANLISHHGVTNVLLIGQDRRPGEGTERTRSDSMILCSINPDTKEVSLISFMRDMYVYYPEYGYKDKMCHTYVYGGMQGLDDTIAYNFGVDIDYNVEVDFESFSQIIDTIGGVDIELDGDEASVVGVGYESGTYHLDGEEALSYARIRKLDSDFVRTSRQRNVISAVFNQAKHSDAETLMNLVNTVLPMLTTDMTNKEIITLATELIPMLSDMQLNSYRIPPDGTWEFGWTNEMSVLLVDFEECTRLLEEEYLPLN